MNKLNVLFWNIGKQDASKEIVAFAQKYDVDVFVLVENQTPIVKLLNSFSASNKKFHLCTSSDRKITILTSFNQRFFEVLDVNSNYLSLVRLKLFATEILFGGIHLPSKLTISKPSAYSMIVRELVEGIKEAEKRFGHNKTILVGDFNMNPFEDSMVEPDAFNASMCREVAGVGYRNVSGIVSGRSLKYLYFYNPMWSYLGDLSKDKPGTYYLYGNSTENHFRWNMLDQVLIRPALISNFVEDSLEIIEDTVEGQVLIDSKARSRRKGFVFDHLPVFFSLDLTK